MNSTIFKQFVKKYLITYRGRAILIKLRDRILPVRGKNNKIKVRGNILGLKKSIIGNDNIVDIQGATIKNSYIRIRGNRNILIIEEGCVIGNECSFWLEGNNNKIVIGKNTTMTLLCHLNAQEHDTNIIVGEDCMFSNTIIVRTSDSHPIYNNQGERINAPNDVRIGNHVWIAPNSVLMKGSVVGDGSIVASHSMVNKTFPSNSLLAGTPAKVIKENVNWTRESVLM